MKTCTQCGGEFPVGFFNKCGVKSDGTPKYRANCKECSRADVAKWAVENRERLYKKRKEIRDSWKLEIIKIHGDCCKLCKQSFQPCVYDFHHIDPAQKEFQIAAASSFERAVEEASKCVMLCSNCHRIVHFGQTPDNLFTWDVLGITTSEVNSICNQI